jgi:hypothetical protein
MQVSISGSWLLVSGLWLFFFDYRPQPAASGLRITETFNGQTLIGWKKKWIRTK